MTKPTFYVITTEDELQANTWPMGTVVQEVHTGECCEERFCDFYPQLWEMAFQCGWTRAGKDYDHTDDSPRLPVRLLWLPEWAPGPEDSVFRSGGMTKEYGPRPRISVPRPRLT